MNIDIRSYRDSDYLKVHALYQDSQLYGGQFDPVRDAREVLQKRIHADANAILIAEINGIIVGTLSYIEDGRVAMLFRFAVQKGGMEPQVTEALLDKASFHLKAKGHKQVLIYSPAEDERLHGRYTDLGMHRGNDYTCYWKEI